MSDKCDGNKDEKTYVGAASKSSPPRLKLPNCIPIFSILEPKLAGSTTGWSDVLNFGARCETGVGREDMDGVGDLTGTAIVGSGAGCCTTTVEADT